jgi:uncharacterized protein
VACGARDCTNGVQSEWPATLNVQALAANGWQPTPFQQFIIKLHSRCNLSCTYCYVYELADQTWRMRPRVMSTAIVSVVAWRIAEHARAHNLNAVRVIFHGGEPLLAGTAPIVDALRKIRAAVDARVQVDGWVQTNGTLLDEDALEALASLNIKVGISLDGGMATHDRSRRHPNGRGSYQEVVRGLHGLMRRPQIYSGILCVIDVYADPVAIYESLLKFEPPTIDFLLPHGNWSSRPPGRPDSASAPYAKWLIAIFDRWYDTRPKVTRIRLFDEIIHLVLGGKSATEAVGLTATSLVVIETDGSIEQSDSLKSTYEGAADTGLHIARDSFDDALRLPQVAATQLGPAALCADCLKCSIHHICGAGLYAHRYRANSGFLNRSVYCQDLYALIIHIRTRLVHDLRDLRTS